MTLSPRPTEAETQAAAEVLGEHLRPSPPRLQPDLGALLDSPTYLKYEIDNPVKSFKIRGALNLAQQVASDPTVSGLATVSTGNHGAAMAYAGQLYGIPMLVAVPSNADPSKVELIRRFGATLQTLGQDMDETRELLLEGALPKNFRFVEDGTTREIVAA